MEYVDKVENTNHSDEIVEEEEEESIMWWHQIATVLDKSYPKKTQPTLVSMSENTRTFWDLF